MNEMTLVSNLHSYSNLMNSNEQSVCQHISPGILPVLYLGDRTPFLLILLTLFLSASLNRWHLPSASSGLRERNPCCHTSRLSWCGRIPPQCSVVIPFEAVPQSDFDGYVCWEHSTYAHGRKSQRRQSEQSNTGPSSLDAYNIWFWSTGMSPWSSGNVLCGQNLGVDSSRSRRIATAGCAVQEKEDKRWWRPAQEQRTDGRKDFMCAVCEFVEKRARENQFGVELAVCSTLQ